MRADVVLLLAASVLGVPDRPKKVDRVKKEMKQFQGTWKVVSVEHMGQLRQGSNLRVTFKGNKYTATSIGNRVIEEGTFSIDPSRKLKTIDLSILTGNDKGSIQRGLYELQGDTLKFCLAQPGKDRPIAFSTRTGTGFELFVLKRVKE
jgi:uncharacterized protein (TIGR03067 family)